MAPGKLDLKFTAVLGISLAALLLSLYSWHKTNQLEEQAFAPSLAITDLHISGTHPEDAMEEEPILHYKIQNQGRTSLHNLHIAEVVMTDANHSVNREMTERGSFDPSEPVDTVVYLTPTIVVPRGFTVSQVEDGKIALSIQFETEASTDRAAQYRTCSKFRFNHRTQKFDRSANCTPEVFK